MFLPKYYPKECPSDPKARAFTKLGSKKEWLGLWGSPESRQKFAKILSNTVLGLDPLEGIGERAVDSEDAKTVEQLVSAFLDYSKSEHAKARTASYENSTQILRAMFGATLVTDFGPMSLRAVRETMAKKPKPNGKKRSRRDVNRRVGEIRHVFKWGVSIEWVPERVWIGLTSLDPIMPGRNGNLVEKEAVQAVPIEHIRATVDCLPLPLAAMVVAHLNAAARPCEMVIMRPVDIDRSEDVWLYTPREHKNDWREKDGTAQERVIALNPEAQAALAPLMLRPETFPMFVPAEAEIARGRRPRKGIAPAYTVGTYRQAVHRACKAAGVPKWNPGQLRHTGLTEIAHRFGENAAKVQGGHEDIRSTRNYLKDDHEGAREAVRSLSFGLVVGQ